MASLKLLALSIFAALSLARSPEHVGRRISGYSDVRERAQRNQWNTLEAERASKVKRADPLFLNNKTQSYSVNGSAIPDVDFDIGESYAGLLPISNTSADRELYFWFFPSQNPDATDEITIWLNGGPGCSSLEGFLQENGPFQWQYGTYAPVPNPWTWVNLTNIVWVEQPVGTGFSQGSVEAKSEVDVANEFMGFFRNFVDLFDLQGKKVYVTGESYAGMYVPYISSAMLNASDTTYFNLNGMMIYDPSINYDEVLEDMQAVPFVNYWEPLFGFNQTFMDDLNARDEACGYKAFRDENMAYPPTGKLPSPPEVDGNCSSIYNDIVEAAQAVNPCWDIYQVATTCPLLWDVLGFPGSFEYSPTGATIYFDRPEVKAAINAPVNKTWEECASNNVYNNSNGNSYEANNGLWSGLTVLPGVIDALNNTIIAHGVLDMILIKNGTLMTIQNMTFGGTQGFSEYPSDDFFVPYHDDYEYGALAGAGVMGKTRTERGLTFVEIQLSGHMVPQYAPSAAFRQMEFLLGRIPSLSSTVPFTTSDDGLQALPPGPVDPNDGGR